MNIREIRLVCSLAGIFALRMLGLCMLLPLFAIEACNYSQATPQLIGIAIGSYGLTQALLQIPFGMLSDRFGRRPVLIVGLLLLLLGSLIASFSTSIYGLILGRILQGSGAIGSVIIAALADNTREQVRASAMAVLGITIGAAFVIALVLGPWLTQALGIGAVFLLTGMLAILGIALILMTIPKSATRQAPLKLASCDRNWRNLVGDQKILSLHYGIFALHASLAALFLVLPLLIAEHGYAKAEVWRLYLQTFLVALPFAIALIAVAEKRNMITQLQMYSIAGLFLSVCLLQLIQQRAAILYVLILFFTAFCVLEAILPSLVAKYAPVQQRGAVMGMYSSMQFLGVFCGGAIGGWLHGKFGITAVLQFCMMLAVVWLIVNFLVMRIKKWQEA